MIIKNNSEKKGANIFSEDKNVTSYIIITYLKKKEKKKTILKWQSSSKNQHSFPTYIKKSLA